MEPSKFIFRIDNDTCCAQSRAREQSLTMATLGLLSYTQPYEGMRGLIRSATTAHRLLNKQSKRYLHQLKPADDRTGPVPSTKRRLKGYDYKLSLQSRNWLRSVYIPYIPNGPATGNSTRNMYTSTATTNKRNHQACITHCAQYHIRTFSSIPFLRQLKSRLNST